MNPPRAPFPVGPPPLSPARCASAPRDVRERYAGEMEEVFLDQRGEPRYRGLLGALRFWIDIIRDFAVGIGELSRRGPTAAKP